MYVSDTKMEELIEDPVRSIRSVWMPSLPNITMQCNKMVDILVMMDYTYNQKA